MAYSASQDPTAGREEGRIEEAGGRKGVEPMLGPLLKSPIE